MQHSSTKTSSDQHASGAGETTAPKERSRPYWRNKKKGKGPNNDEADPCSTCSDGNIEGEHILPPSEPLQPSQKQERQLGRGDSSSCLDIGNSKHKNSRKNARNGSHGRAPAVGAEASAKQHRSAPPSAARPPGLLRPPTSHEATASPHPYRLGQAHTSAGAQVNATSEAPSAKDPHTVEPTMKQVNHKVKTGRKHSDFQHSTQGAEHGPAAKLAAQHRKSAEHGKHVDGARNSSSIQNSGASQGGPNGKHVGKGKRNTGRSAHAAESLHSARGSASQQAHGQQIGKSRSRQWQPQSQHGEQEQSRQAPQRGKRPIFAQHIGRELLQQGLKSGQLFKALFRCNAADRSQGFCTVEGLPSDVFVKGYKSQNRAIEGDEVVIRILSPQQWHPLAAAEASKQPRTPQQAPQQAHTMTQSNVVPAPGLKEELSAPGPGQPAAVRGAAVAMGDLLATPSLRTSASGGELGFALGPGTVRSHPIADLSESSEEGSVVNEELSEEEKEMVLEELEDDFQVLTLLEQGGARNTASTSSPLEQAASKQRGARATRDNAKQWPATEGAPHHTSKAVPDAESAAESMLDFVLSQASSSSGAAATQLKASDRTHPPAASTASTEAAPLQSWYTSDSAEEGVEMLRGRLQALPGWRITGEVVAVVEPSRRREVVVGVLKQEGGIDNGVLLLFPCDPRLPKMLVRSSQLPEAIKATLKREAAFADLSTRTLVSAHVEGWEVHHMFPLARVRESLGQAGDLATETKALLEMEQVVDDDQFMPEVLACLPPTPWSISDNEIRVRRDFRQQRVFSIDPPTARDLDDALSVEDMGDGRYRVGVHIADVSFFVRPGTALDEEAQQRSTSVYLVDRVIPMLPRLLCEELCSLNPGVDRLCFSIVWDMTEEGDIESTWVGRSVIRSCGKLAYPMVQSMIDGQYLAREGEEPPCSLHGQHTWKQVVGDSLTLCRIARNLRRRRFENGALRLDNIKLFFKLDDDGNPEDYGVYEQREANQLVEEFMLLANMTAARTVAQSFPDRALLRCHPPPNQQKMGELCTLAADLGFQLDTSSAGALQASLKALREAAGDDAVVDILTLLATKPMQVARYFCTGEATDESCWRHYALAVSHYTHFTSPIRRYPDIVVHRLLAAAIDAGGSKQEKVARHGLFEAQQVGMIAAHSNGRKLAAKAVQDGSLRLYLCVMLNKQPLICDGVVMCLGGSRFFDVYIPSLGMDVRIHTNSVLQGGDDSIVSAWNKETKVLTMMRSKAGVHDQPDYTDVPNFSKVKNNQDVSAMHLPITLRMLGHVSIVVSSRKSQTSGSPTHVTAKLWVV